MSDAIEEMKEASWALARECLDILPPDDLATSGLALIHVIIVWLAEIPEEARPQTYMQWMDMLHRQLNHSGVMHVQSHIEKVPIPEGSDAVH